MSFPGGIPVPEEVSKLRCEQRVPRIALTVCIGIQAYTQQLLTDIGEFGCTFTRPNRDPAFSRTNNEQGQRISGAGCSGDPGVRCSHQPAIDLIILEGRIRIDRARYAQVGTARIRRELECSRAVYTSVAG